MQAVRPGGTPPDPCDVDDWGEDSNRRFEVRFFDRIEHRERVFGVTNDPAGEPLAKALREWPRASRIRVVEVHLSRSAG